MVLDFGRVINLTDLTWPGLVWSVNPPRPGPFAEPSGAGFGQFRLAGPMARPPDQGVIVRGLKCDTPRTNCRVYTEHLTNKTSAVLQYGIKNHPGSFQIGGCRIHGLGHPLAL